MRYFAFFLGASGWVGASKVNKDGKRLHALLPIKSAQLTELREVACLVLLSGAMVFAVLNIAVHRLSEDQWKPLNHGLSPDGKEYVSISLAGLRIHDVASGKETARVSWLSPWKKLLDGDLFWYGEPAHIADLRADDLGFSNRWTAIPEERSESRVTIVMSDSGRYVIGKFPAGYALWWDRKFDRVKIHYFDAHLPLRCFVNEAHDQFHFESLQIGKPIFQRNEREWPSADMDFSSNYLGRPLDVQLFRLSDGEKLADYPGRANGAPVNNNPNLRLVADRKAERLTLESWTAFPDGQLKIESLQSVAGIPDLGDCRAETSRNGVKLLEASEEGIFESTLGSQQSSRTLLHKKSKTCGIAPFQTPGVYFCQFEGATFLAMQLPGEQARTRYIDFDPALRWRDVICTSLKAQSVLRIANEEGAILDLPRESTTEVSQKQMRLAPYPYAFAVSLLASAVALVLWAINAWKSKTLFCFQGALVFCVGIAWPLVCWFSDLAFGSFGHINRPRLFLTAVCTLLLALCIASLVSHPHKRRPICLAVATAASYLLIGCMTCNQPQEDW
jgi:hypothetical protein